MNIYIVIQEDRHTDIETTPFKKLADAKEFAWKSAHNSAWLPSDCYQHKEIPFDCELYITYNDEGDAVRVVKEELR